MIEVQKPIFLLLLAFVLASPTTYSQTTIFSEAEIQQNIDSAYKSYFEDNNPLVSLMKYTKGTFNILEERNPSISLHRNIALRDSLYHLVDTIFYNEAGADTYKGLFALLESHYHSGLELYYEANKQGHDLKYGNKFLELSEKSNALFLKVSNTLADERGELLNIRKEIKKLENKRSKLLSVTQPSYDTIRQIDNSINELTAQLNTKTVSKRLFNQKQQGTISIQDIQQKLSNDEGLISYHHHATSPNVLLALLVTKDTFNIYKQTTDLSIEELVSNYEEGIRYNYDAVSKIGSTLYKLLFKSLESLIANKKRLYIVKDEIIGFLPLEALPYQQPDNDDKNYANLPYLVRRHSIIYLPSTSILSQYEKKSILSCPLLVAPIFDKKLYDLYPGKVDTFFKEIPSLKTSLPFLTAIDNEFKIKALKRREATISNIKQLGSQHNFIHLDTHTFLDKDNLFDESKVVFAPKFENGSISENFLSLNDVFELDFKPEVLILGSCNTGVGRHEFGEGIISMGYNFHLLGVQCIMYSSWSLEENSTHNIIKLFYQNLNNSTAIDYALQQAKIDYLYQNDNWKKASNAAPYYWAGMSVSGVPVKVKLERSDKRIMPVILLLMLVGLVIGIGVVYWYNRK